MEARVIDGNLYCKFVRQSPLTVQGRVFDLSGSANGRPFLLLSRGPVKGDAVLGYHQSQRSVSASRIDFAETGAVGGRSDIYIKLHGAFMAAAWLFSASLGILFARYFRLTWVGKQFQGKDLWFVVSRLILIILFIRNKK